MADPQEILIVDPQPGAGDLMAVKLKKSGYAVTVTSTIGGAIQALARLDKPYAAVLVHIHRDTKGLSAFPQQVKTLPKLAAQPFLVGYASRGDGKALELAHQSGFQDSFFKPIEQAELIKLVKKWLP
jgi:CheY-like chemotaxis protein